MTHSNHNRNQVLFIDFKIGNKACKFIFNQQKKKLEAKSRTKEIKGTCARTDRLDAIAPASSHENRIKSRYFFQSFPFSFTRPNFPQRKTTQKKNLNLPIQKDQSRAVGGNWVARF